jgi:hypothetical protein
MACRKCSENPHPHQSTHKGLGDVSNDIEQIMSLNVFLNCHPPGWLVVVMIINLLK